ARAGGPWSPAGSGGSWLQPARRGFNRPPSLRLSCAITRRETARLRARCRWKREGWTMAVDTARAGAAQAQVEEIARGVEGIIGVYARDLASGVEVALNADTIFPTASVMKIPILYELYRQAEAGQVDLAKRITLEAHHLVPGSGILQDLDL